MIVPIINWSNFVYLLVNPGWFLFSHKFLWSIALRSHYKMDAPDRHNGQMDEQTNGRVSLSVCLLDGIWRKLRLSFATTCIQVKWYKCVICWFSVITLLTIHAVVTLDWVKSGNVRFHCTTQFIPVDLIKCVLQYGLWHCFNIVYGGAMEQKDFGGCKAPTCLSNARVTNWQWFCGVSGK